jgi:hypothetical protein
MSNALLISADRTTHLKVMGVAVIATVTAGLAGFNARGMQTDPSAHGQAAVAPAAVGSGGIQPNRLFPADSVRG